MNYYNYFTEIEDTFIRRRGKHLLLSPLDWAMIEGWQDRGIPLHIVLRGIESVFDAFDKNPGPRTIKGLLYCREEVEAQFLEWSAAQVGKSDAAAVPTVPNDLISTDDIREHITRAISTLKDAKGAALREDLDRAADRLTELNKHLTADLEATDKSLCDIENFLDQALLAKTEKTHLKRLEKEVAGQLRPHKADMKPEAYEQTFRLMLLKSLREDVGVPRLGLFYM